MGSHVVTGKVTIIDKCEIKKERFMGGQDQSWRDRVGQAEEAGCG